MKPSKERIMSALLELRNKAYWRGYNDHIKKGNDSMNEDLIQALQEIQRIRLEDLPEEKKLEDCCECIKTVTIDKFGYCQECGLSIGEYKTTVKTNEELREEIHNIRNNLIQSMKEKIK